MNKDEARLAIMGAISMALKDPSLQQVFEIICKNLVELEKENAELKKDKKELCHSISEGGKACVYLNEQLTKAKELLERLLITSCNSDVLNLLPNCSEVLRVRVEAEQFLKYSDMKKENKQK